MNELIYIIIHTFNSQSNDCHYGDLLCNFPLYWNRKACSIDIHHACVNRTWEANGSRKLAWMTRSSPLIFISSLGIIAWLVTILHLTIACTVIRPNYYFWTFLLLFASIDFCHMRLQVRACRTKLYLLYAPLVYSLSEMLRHVLCHSYERY